MACPALHELPPIMDVDLPEVLIAAEVVKERRRIQPLFDDVHHAKDVEHGELSIAAAALAMGKRYFLNGVWRGFMCWPWKGLPDYVNRRADLIRAQAYLMAEVQRLDVEKAGVKLSDKMTWSAG
jgi:hypothetical protein